MTREQERLAYELITNPPPGSKIAAAKAFGVDLTLLYERLKQTPTERAHSFASVAQFFGNLQASENKTALTK